MLEKLLIQATSRDPNVRFEAIVSLADIPGDEARTALIRAGSDPNPQVAALSVSILAEKGDVEARRLIIDLLNRMAPQWLHQSALYSAGIVDISPNLDSAWQALKSRFWMDRTAGAGALAKASERSALLDIIRLWSEAHRRRQFEAEAHLTGCGALLGDKRSKEIFLECLSSDAWRSRGAAAAFLDRRGRLDAMAQAIGKTRLKATLKLSLEKEGHEAIPRHESLVTRLIRNLDGL